MNADAPAAEISEVEIREIAGQKELRAVEELQKEVWGIPDLDVVPLSQLAAAQASGGVLLGAFDGEDLVGFAYGFPSLENGQAAHHSHMLAVKPEYRNFNLGEQLKRAQRECVLSQGLTEMSWTFDPLQSVNAYFNFNKLGVYSNRYFINFYGEEATSFLHRTGTDRLWVTWHLTNPQIDKTDFNAELEKIVPLVKVGIDKFPLINDSVEGLKRNRALIEIPPDINDLVKSNSESANKWRELTRRAFTEAINAGFTVENFFIVNRGDRKHGVYLLTRKD